MNEGRRRGRIRAMGRGIALLVALATVGRASDAPLDQAAAIRKVDAAVQMRVNRIAGYTVTEHYAVFRGKDETNAVAEMTVKTTYRRETGKSYQIVSQGGSAVIRRLGLDPLLEREQEINMPGKVEHSWITSANYDMTLKPGSQMLDGHECLAFAITPKRKAPNLLVGTLWVDANDFTIARLDGVASKSPSVFAGVTHMTRNYAYVDGFSMATHARAESTTFLYGRTVVTIDYTGYQIRLRPGTQSIGAGGVSGAGAVGRVSDPGTKGQRERGTPSAAFQ